MKKRLGLLVSLILIVILATGCKIRQESALKITKDGEISLAVVMALDNQGIDELISLNESNGENGEVKTHTDAERWEYLESSVSKDSQEKYKDYKEERYEDGEYKGYKFSIGLGNIQNLTADKVDEELDLTALNEDSKMFTYKDGVYTLLTNSQNTTNNSDAVSLTGENASDMVSLLFEVTLPNEAVKHNATTVSEDKLTYSWDLLKTDKVELSFRLDADEEKKTSEEQGAVPEKEETPVQEGVEEKMPWAKASSWAESELKNANANKLIPMIFDNEDLTKNITRKEFAHVAVKLYEAISGKVAVVALSNPFTDCDDTEVLKAFDLEITKGMSETTFEPDLEITREQMATMIARALSKADVDVKKYDPTARSEFADDNEMHDWSRDAIYFMADREIIKGIGDNKFGVTDNSTREAALLIAVRSVEKLAK